MRINIGIREADIRRWQRSPHLLWRRGWPIAAAFKRIGLPIRVVEFRGRLVFFVKETEILLSTGVWDWLHKADRFVEDRQNDGEPKESRLHAIYFSAEIPEGICEEYGVISDLGADRYFAARELDCEDNRRRTRICA